MSGIPEGAGVTRLRRFLVGSALVVGTLLGAGDAVAQNLEEYDYENLGLRALGVDVVWANAKDAKGAVGFGVRADLGFLGPYVRVVPRFKMNPSPGSSGTWRRCATRRVAA
jgi:hypothetical protein